jgi:hypothetical protein
MYHCHTSLLIAGVAFPACYKAGELNVLRDLSIWLILHQDSLTD